MYRFLWEPCKKCFCFPVAGKLGQINSLKDENDALKCQVEAYKNELSMMKTDNQNKTVGTKQEVKSLQLALQGMQQVLNFTVGQGKGLTVRLRLI